MPRRNVPKRSKRAGGDEEEQQRPLSLGSNAQAPSGWQARTIQPMQATKRYVCPGCELAVEPNTKHVVAWPMDAESHRRHWHGHCWSATIRSGRRPPT